MFCKVTPTCPTKKTGSIGGVYLSFQYSVAGKRAPHVQNDSYSEWRLSGRDTCARQQKEYLLLLQRESTPLWSTVCHAEMRGGLVQHCTCFASEPPTGFPPHGHWCAVGVDRDQPMCVFSPTNPLVRGRPTREYLHDACRCTAPSPSLLSSSHGQCTSSSQSQRGHPRASSRGCQVAQLV